MFAGLGDGHGFPPTLVVVCDGDDLRPSGEAFAATLTDNWRRRATSPRGRRRHGHIDQPGDAAALRTIEAVAEWLARGIHRHD